VGPRFGGTDLVALVLWRRWARIDGVARADSRSVLRQADPPPGRTAVCGVQQERRRAAGRDPAVLPIWVRDVQCPIEAELRHDVPVPLPLKIEVNGADRSLRRSTARLWALDA
jgi:hypothetical protein